MSQQKQRSLVRRRVDTILVLTNNVRDLIENVQHQRNELETYVTSHHILYIPKSRVQLVLNATPSLRIAETAQKRGMDAAFDMLETFHKLLFSLYHLYATLQRESDETLIPYLGDIQKYILTLQKLLHPHDFRQKQQQKASSIQYRQFDSRLRQTLAKPFLLKKTYLRRLTQIVTELWKLTVETPRDAFVNFITPQEQEQQGTSKKRPRTTY